MAGSLATGVGGGPPGGTATPTAACCWGAADAPAMILFGVIGPSVGFVEGGGWVEMEVVGGIPLEGGAGGWAGATVGAAGAWFTDGKEAVAGRADPEEGGGTAEGCCDGGGGWGDAAATPAGPAGIIPTGPPTACLSTGLAPGLAVEDVEDAGGIVPDR